MSPFCFRIETILQPLHCAPCHIQVPSAASSCVSFPLPGSGRAAYCWLRSKASPWACINREYGNFGVAVSRQTSGPLNSRATLVSRHCLSTGRTAGFKGPEDVSHPGSLLPHDRQDGQELTDAGRHGREDTTQLGHSLEDQNCLFAQTL